MPATLTMSAQSAANKVYDATTVASVSGSASVQALAGEGGAALPVRALPGIGEVPVQAIQYRKGDGLWHTGDRLASGRLRPDEESLIIQEAGSAPPPDQSWDKWLESQSPSVQRHAAFLLDLGCRRRQAAVVDLDMADPAHWPSFPFRRSRRARTESPCA